MGDNQFAATVERLNQLALGCRQRGDHSVAVKYYRQALAAVERALGSGDVNVATMIQNIAAVYNEQGRHDLAAAENERALAIRRQALGQDHPAVAGDLTDLAHTRMYQQRYDEAESLFQQALTLSSKLSGELEVHLLEWLINVAGVLRQHRRFALTRTFLERARGIAERRLPPDHPATVQIGAQLVAPELRPTRQSP